MTGRGLAARDIAIRAPTDRPTDRRRAMCSAVLWYDVWHGVVRCGVVWGPPTTGIAASTGSLIRVARKGVARGARAIPLGPKIL